MFRKDREVPPCGHVDRRHELTIIEVVNTRGLPIELKVCAVPTCREYCRPFIDLRDDWDAMDREQEMLARIESGELVVVPAERAERLAAVRKA